MAVRPRLTVLRYAIPSVREQRYFELMVHYGAGVLGFHEDRTIVSRTEAKYEHVIAFLVNPHEPVEKRMFRIATWGENLDDLIDRNYSYIGTIHSISGYVFHLFEVYP
jgi:hypothetical protein